jgi:hypothetical protein
MRHVEKMIVLWSAAIKPPNIHGLSANESRCLKKLIIQQIDNNHSLTLRFKTQLDNITTDAVFSLDDDLLVAEDDVDRAFDIWKTHPWGVVGFNERQYSWSNKTGFRYGGRHNGTYHFILTDAAFMHRNYLNLFDRHLKPSIRDEIDRRKNCEDLAMNVLIGNYCRCTVAFLVKYRHDVKVPSSSGSGKTKFKSGLSSRPRHYIERSECLNSLSRFYRVKLAPNSCIY